MARDYRSLIFPPPRAIKAALDEIERRAGQTSFLDWGISEMDKRFNPLVPGDCMTLLARPGMCKTTSAMYLTKFWANKLRGVASPNGRPPVIVYFTSEVLIEEFMAVYSAEHSGATLQDIGRGVADIIKIKSALVKGMGDNVILVGMSNQDVPDQDHTGVYFPSMYDLDLILRDLINEGYHVAAVFVDYLQQLGDRMNRASYGKMVETVSENFMLAKNIGKAHKTGMVVCAQAKRDVDDYAGLKFPLLGDGQWASLIEQATDKCFSLTVPSKYMDEGEKFVINGWEYAVNDRTLAIRKTKERFGVCDSSDVYILQCDYGKALLSSQAPEGEFRDEEVPY